jgi:predicted RNA-binding protein YlxR (DUF448 family)
LSFVPAMTRFDEKVAAASARPVRTCLVTGAERNPEQMLRFVVGPQGEVVPDLARRLPGRGMWLTADAAALGGVFGREQAVYVAVARDDRSGRFIERIAGGAARWRRYRLDGAG